MNNNISEEEFDALLSENNKNAPIGLDEFDRMLSEKENPSISTGQRLSQIPKNLLTSLAQEGLNIPQDIMEIPSFLTRGIIKNPMEQGYEIPGLGPNPFAGKAQIPGYEGIKETPEAYIASALPYLLPAYGGAKLGLKAAKSASTFLSGKKPVKTAEEFIKSLTGNHKISEIHEGINKELANNFSKVKEKESSLWKEAENIANKEKYHGEPAGLSKALGAKSEFKSIEAPKALDKIEELDVHDKELKNRISAFKEKPSFKNAHDLQSRLGQQSSDLYRSSDSTDRSLAHQYTNARKTLIDEMKSTFKKHGDDDLVNAIEKASNFTKNNVVPYTKNRTINSIVTKKGLEEVQPENIHTILSKGDKSIKRIIEDLSPKAKNLILAKHLKSAVAHSEKGGQTVNIEKLSSALNKVKNSSAEKFLTPEHREIIKKIEKQSGVAPKIVTGAKAAGGIALGALGLERLNHFLRNMGVY